MKLRRLRLLEETQGQAPLPFTSGICMSRCYLMVVDVEDWGLIGFSYFYIYRLLTQICLQSNLNLSCMFSVNFFLIVAPFDFYTKCHTTYNLDEDSLVLRNYITQIQTIVEEFWYLCRYLNWNLRNNNIIRIPITTISLIVSHWITNYAGTQFHSLTNS